MPEDGPALALRKTVNQLLKDAGRRLYDRVSDDAVFPYHRAEVQTLGDSAQGYDGSELALTLHTFSQAVGSVEAERLAYANRLLLAPPPGSSAPFAIEGHEIVNWLFEGTQSVGDPDPLVTHLVSNFTYLTRPTA